LIFAEVVPTAADWKGFGIILLFLLTIADKLGLMRWLKPERREVTFPAEHPTKTEFEKLSEHVTNIESYNATRRKAIYERIESVQREIGGQIQSLRNEMRDVAVSTGETRAQCESATTHIVHLRSDITQMLQNQAKKS